MSKLHEPLTRLSEDTYKRYNEIWERVPELQDSLASAYREGDQRKVTVVGRMIDLSHTESFVLRRVAKCFGMLERDMASPYQFLVAERASLHALRAARDFYLDRGMEVLPTIEFLDQNLPRALELDEQYRAFMEPNSQ